MASGRRGTPRLPCPQRIGPEPSPRPHDTRKRYRGTTGKNILQELSRPAFLSQRPATLWPAEEIDEESGQVWDGGSDVDCDGGMISRESKYRRPAGRLKGQWSITACSPPSRAATCCCFRSCGLQPSFHWRNTVYHPRRRHQERRSGSDRGRPGTGPGAAEGDCPEQQCPTAIPR